VVAKGIGWMAVVCLAKGEEECEYEERNYRLGREGWMCRKEGAKKSSLFAQRVEGGVESPESDALSCVFDRIC